jgi:hypothetical protein
MQEQRLFEGAPEAVILSCHYTMGEGWTARLQIRRQFEDWADARTEVYDRLTTQELADALDALSASIYAGLGL